MNKIREIISYPFTVYFFLLTGGPGLAGEQGALRPDLSPVNAGPEHRHHGNQGPDSLPAERKHDKDRRKGDVSQHRGNQHA